MDTFFRKAVVFGDSHYGRSSDSPTANQDNLDFLDWMINRARTWGAETCIFLGDWFHNRAAIGVQSLDQALNGLERLSNAGFEKVIFLKGNHDLARRQDREVSSLNVSRYLPNLTLINHPLVVDNVVFLPWLFPEDEPMLATLRGRYGFGHLETVGAMTNEKITYTGGSHATGTDVESFHGIDEVYSGHFHHRQRMRNITYIGSAMCHDFNDANDADRGMMLLQWGQEPIFEAWPDQPLFRVEPLSHLLEHLDILRPKMTVRTTIDIELGYEEAQNVRDMLSNDFGIRKLELFNTAPVAAGQEQDIPTDLHTIDEIVVDSLRTIESKDLDNDRLIEIFLGLPR